MAFFIVVILWLIFICPNENAVNLKLASHYDQTLVKTLPALFHSIFICCL